MSAPMIPPTAEDLTPLLPRFSLPPRLLLPLLAFLIPLFNYDKSLLKHDSANPKRRIETDVMKLYVFPALP
ncbi:hypothetical protein K488DRAFT_81820 [Vararia minispora EC-137]|uniref:Uncharacterized protein n=1 Tax=Vararia minispora EC-137 TaxID=1314806 RepID=A0ACB8QY43_9AGAM|nr:hypothetical protein K488DRAFT_81820 [Vararia minispora EC-137]